MIHLNQRQKGDPFTESPTYLYSCFDDMLVYINKSVLKFEDRYETLILRGVSVEGNIAPGYTQSHSNEKHKVKKYHLLPHC